MLKMGEKKHQHREPPLVQEKCSNVPCCSAEMGRGKRSLEVTGCSNNRGWYEAIEKVRAT